MTAATNRNHAALPAPSDIDMSCLTLLMKGSQWLIHGLNADGTCNRFFGGGFNMSSFTEFTRHVSGGTVIVAIDMPFRGLVGSKHRFAAYATAAPGFIANIIILGNPDGDEDQQSHTIPVSGDRGMTIVIISSTYRDWAERNTGLTCLESALFDLLGSHQLASMQVDDIDTFFIETGLNFGFERVIVLEDDRLDAPASDRLRARVTHDRSRRG